MDLDLAASSGVGCGGCSRSQPASVHCVRCTASSARGALGLPQQRLQEEARPQARWVGPYLASHGAGWVGVGWAGVEDMDIRRGCGYATLHRQAAGFHGAAMLCMPRDRERVGHFVFPHAVTRACKQAKWTFLRHQHRRWFSREREWRYWAFINRGNAAGAPARRPGGGGRHAPGGLTACWCQTVNACVIVGFMLPRVTHGRAAQGCWLDAVAYVHVMYDHNVGHTWHVTQ